MFKRWMKPTGYMVLAFVCLYFWIRSAEADTLLEVMPATIFVGGDHYQGAGLSLTERFSGRYDLGVLLMTEMQCGDCRRGPGEGNLAIHATRVVHYKAFEMGIGAAYWQNQTIYFNSNTSFALHWGFSHNRWSIRHRHFSTGGSSERNSGLDMLTIGYNFE